MRMYPFAGKAVWYPADVFPVTLTTVLKFFTD